MLCRDFAAACAVRCASIFARWLFKAASALQANSADLTVSSACSGAAEDGGSRVTLRGLPHLDRNLHVHLVLASESLQSQQRHHFQQGDMAQEEICSISSRSSLASSSCTSTMSKTSSSKARFLKRPGLCHRTPR